MCLPVILATIRIARVNPAFSKSYHSTTAPILLLGKRKRRHDALVPMALSPSTAAASSGVDADDPVIYKLQRRLTKPGAKVLVSKGHVRHGRTGA